MAIDVLKIGEAEGIEAKLEAAWLRNRIPGRGLPA